MPKRVCYSPSMNEQTQRYNETHLPALRAKFQCQVLAGGDAEYDAARRVWNGMIDRKQAMIVRATGIADVMQAVRIARDQRLAVCVRGGGHSVAGKSVANDAMMIDLSLMNGVEINPRACSAVAQGGAKFAEFDRECERYQLAATGGVISADLVSADGAQLSVSASQNEDLYWAIRGGGGNFGIVTALEFRLHSLQSVHGGLLLYPRSSAIDLLRRYRDVTGNAPDELTAYAALMIGHGHPMVAIAMCHSGSHSEGANVGKQFYLTEPPAVDLTGEKKYTEMQSMLDFTAPAGLHYYFKCSFLRELTDEAIRAIIEHAECLPTEQSQVIFEHMHGVASRFPATETAFGLRRTQYSINIGAAWNDPTMAEKCIDWARRLASVLEGFGASDGYVNYLGDEGSAAVRASYGGNYGRLAELKKKYDPDNFFQFNQNILPTP